MKTIYYDGLEAATSMGFQHEILPNTTLNEYHGVGLASVASNPKLGFFAIGMQLTNLVSDDGIFNLNRNLHNPDHGNVFKPIPFRLVKRELKLSNDEAFKYRLIKEMTINGEIYVAYYLKTIDDINKGRYLNVTTDNSNNTTFSIYSSEKTSILNPVPQVPNGDNSESLSYTKPIQMELSEVEISNIKEAYELLYGEDTGTIGEIMICSGLDVIGVNGTTETNGVQASIFMEVDIDIAGTEQVITIAEIGGIEVMKLGGI